MSHNLHNTLQEFKIGASKKGKFYSLPALEKALGARISRLPVSEFPEVVPPSVQVRAQYPGANPQVLAETVAAPPPSAAVQSDAEKRRSPALV